VNPIERRLRRLERGRNPGGFPTLVIEAAGNRQTVFNGDRGAGAFTIMPVSGDPGPLAAVLWEIASGTEPHEDGDSARSTGGDGPGVVFCRGPVFNGPQTAFFRCPTAR